jgi:hypothetical protein
MKIYDVNILCEINSLWRGKQSKFRISIKKCFPIWSCWAQESTGYSTLCLSTGNSFNQTSELTNPILCQPLLNADP